MMKKQKVIVLGNDHTNSLGIIQSLGRCGYDMIAVVWGTKTGLVEASRYTSKVYAARDIQSCIDLMLSLYADSDVKIPIIACCDSAALALEKNADRLTQNFLFEHTTTGLTFSYLFQKDNQVALASEAGFNVPKSWLLDSTEVIPSDIIFPCIIKPLVSCQGAKSDLRVCRTETELRDNFMSLKHTRRVLLQQYIERDYEISVLGCGKKDGKCVIPAVENKLTLYPKNVGLECLTYMDCLNDIAVSTSISNLIKRIGYVGNFSVEMMHCKYDNKLYFTEINLRNDGASALVYKYGVNLPLHFVRDMLGDAEPEEEELHPGYYIWDMHHFLSLMHRDIALSAWIGELRKSKGFMTYFKDDRRPFYKQYSNWILQKLHLRKNEYYQ